jgi:hypothetical protein
LTHDDPTTPSTADRDESADPSAGSTEPTTDTREPFADHDLSPPDDRPPARRDDATPDSPTTDDPDDEPIVSRPATMAILSYMSILFGVPVFLVPLVRRRDALSLHHAKAAALVWLAFYAALVLSFFVSGLFTPVMLLLYLPALVGIHRALQGREAGRWGAGDLAEWLFEYPKAES